LAKLLDRPAETWRTFYALFIEF